MADDTHRSVITCKFGGTSVADAAHIKRIASIIQDDSRRRIVVVSAPGKRTPADKKITDLLYLCHHTACEGVDPRGVFSLIRDRYEQIASDLNVAGMGLWLGEVEARLLDGTTMDWVASRGEYLHARLMASYLGARFVDAADCIRIGEGNRLLPETYELTSALLQGDDLVVVPGFYGRDSRGQIKTFSRGGSDITGAIVARAVGALSYENWTDVNGLLMADPRVVDNPRPIAQVSFHELRELAYMGASVLHDEAVFPVREVGIPINIRNTNAPEQPGTWIVPQRPDDDLPIVGVAGRTGFCTIYIEKMLMNQERGFGRKVLEILEHHGISYEHAPSGIDTMSVIMEESELSDKEDGVIDEIRRVLQPDKVQASHGLALVATVGQAMSHRVGIAGKLFAALAEAGVNVRMINQGTSEINIIVGVANTDYEAAVRAIYRAFVSA